MTADLLFLGGFLSGFSLLGVFFRSLHPFFPHGTLAFSLHLTGRDSVLKKIDLLHR